MKPALTFSQRNGIVSVDQHLQREFVSERVRTQIFNYFYKTLKTFSSSPPQDFYESIWGDYCGNRLDELALFGGDAHFYGLISNLILHSSWNELFDFLEFVISYKKMSIFRQKLSQSDIAEILQGRRRFSPAGLFDDVSTGYDNSLVLSLEINKILEQENSAYRIVGGFIQEITNPIEIEEIQKALDNNPYKPCRDHLQRALELMSDCENPDFRNSIKESIDAIESLAKIFTNDEKATFGKAIKKLDDIKKLHPCQKEAFEKLYGWASDDGIRHGKGLKQHTDLTSADARFMLIACSAFVNYVIDVYKDKGETS